MVGLIIVAISKTSRDHRQIFVSDSQSANLGLKDSGLVTADRRTQN